MAHKRFLRFLVGTGIAALIVLAYPVVATFGWLLGGLPGLLLGAAPSLFVYLVVWWGLKWLALKLATVAGFDPATWQVRWTANLVPVAIVLFFAFKIPAMINTPYEQEIAQLGATDVQSLGVIKLPAIVAIELPKSSHGGPRGEGPYCEALCLRLLYNGVVSRVIAAARFHDGTIELASYRIERRDQCAKPDLPRTLIEWAADHLAWSDAGPKGVKQRVEARISAGECLVRDAGRIEDAEAVISVRDVKAGADIYQGPWNPWLDTVGARRLEIVKADGRVLYRYTEVTAAVLSAPLRSTAGGGLLTPVTYAGLARSRTDTWLLGRDARDILPDLLGEEVWRPPNPPDTARP